MFARVVYDSGLEQASLTEVSCLCWVSCSQHQST